MERYEMKRRAYESNLKNRALQVLLYLIDRSNKEGTCFPAVPTIARELHISVSTAKRGLHELIDSGFIKKESRFRGRNQGQTSNLYILCFLNNKRDDNTGMTDSKRDHANANMDLKKSLIENCTGLVRQSEEYDYRSNEPIVFFKKYLKSFEASKLFFCWTGEEVNLLPP